MTPDAITVICGPTAVGKTAFALELALREGGEIISADSGQIYRGLDIGTAKLTGEGRKDVRFHLIDILDPSERFSAADFAWLAREKIQEIRSRGKRTIVVGGTGLYLKVLEEGIFEGPSSDPDVRRKLEEEARSNLPRLYSRLNEIDPEAAARIGPTNRQRLIRALEVYELTGRPISEFWREHRRGGVGGAIKIGLNLPREELNQRIDERIERMICSGWIEETEALLKRWGSKVPGLQIIGYKELVQFLLGGISRERAMGLIKTHTHQLAKRQYTWFRRDPQIEWKMP